jgi:hypothetical protein
VCTEINIELVVRSDDKVCLFYRIYVLHVQCRGDDESAHSARQINLNEAINLE